MRYLGIDYGDARIGIALSDPDGTIAFPQETIQNRGDNEVVRRISGFVKKEHIGHVILGLPISFDGGESEQTKKVRQFAIRLREKISIPLEFENEMLTTKIAKDGGVAKEHADASAAALMLQSYLDKTKISKSK